MALSCFSGNLLLQSSHSVAASSVNCTLGAMAVNPRKVVVFSGGSAANSLVDVFNQVIEKNNCSLTYVIPISDNGGSSSELIRVFGGPGIGDVRSMKSFFTSLYARVQLLL